MYNNSFCANPYNQLFIHITNCKYKMNGHRVEDNRRWYHLLETDYPVEA